MALELYGPDRARMVNRAQTAGVWMNEIRIVLDGESLITPEAVAADIAATHPDVRQDRFATASAELGLILHTARQWFQAGRDPADTMRWTVRSLHAARNRYDRGIWRALVSMAQQHPVAGYFHQDPFTRWSFDKPRGYSGDARLLDFIYRHRSVADDIAAATPTGRALYAYTGYYPSCVAVRERRDLLTRHVDAIAAERGGEAEILTIAAGHLREADRSVALDKGRIGRWVALDQDPLSVGSIARDFSGTPVEAIDGSLRGLLAGSYALGRFDFIYAAGLYDYLAPRVAVRLTRCCLEMLKPDGLLLFANFSPEMTDDGYMESFMDWALLLRSEADMWGIVNASVDRNLVEAKVEFGANRNMLYATVRKAG
jgi:hypothetical protein